MQVHKVAQIGRQGPSDENNVHHNMSSFLAKNMRLTARNSMSWASEFLLYLVPLEENNVLAIPIIFRWQVLTY